MHELGIIGRILGVVLERAAGAGAHTVSAVHLEVGIESDVAPEALEFYWPRVSCATPAEGARLIISECADPLTFRVTAIDVDEPVAVGAAIPGG